jgi:hypothetical protein
MLVLIPGGAIEEVIVDIFEWSKIFANKPLPRPPV